MKLTEKQMDKLKEHAKEHKGGMRSKHMKNMKKMMEEGMSFTEAHKEALKMDKRKPNKKAMVVKKNKSKY